MNISNHKNTILIIIIVLLAFFGYWFFFLSKKEAMAPAQTGGLTTRAPAATGNTGNTQYDKEFVTSLLGLNSVNLDVSVFQSKVYQALSYPEIPFVVNYSRESGRENPFLPIGVDASARTQNTQTQVNVNPATSAPVTTPTPSPTTVTQPKTTPPTTPTAPATGTPKPKTF